MLWVARNGDDSVTCAHATRIVAGLEVAAARAASAASVQWPAPLLCLLSELGDALRVDASQVHAAAAAALGEDAAATAKEELKGVGCVPEIGLPDAVTWPPLRGAAGLLREVDYCQRAMAAEFSLQLTDWECDRCHRLVHGAGYVFGGPPVTCGVCGQSDGAVDDADNLFLCLTFDAGAALGGRRVGLEFACQHVREYPVGGWCVGVKASSTPVFNAAGAVGLGAADVAEWLGADHAQLSGKRLLQHIRRVCELFGRYLSPWPVTCEVAADGGAGRTEGLPAAPLALRRVASDDTACSSCYAYSDGEGGTPADDAILCYTRPLGCRPGESVISLPEGGAGPGRAGEGGAGAVDSPCRRVVVPIAGNDVPPSTADVLNAHFLPPAEEVAATRCLSDMQARAMKHVVVAAARQSAAALPELQAKAAALGFSKSDVLRTLKFIRDDAPIIVHIHLDRLMDKLARDTHLRNQFETGTSCGTLSSSSRIVWEDRLFGNIYHDAKGVDRVKYGVLNPLNDNKGVSSASAYGSSHLVLCGVRLRCSFADRDSSNAATKLASCEHYAHVLNEYSTAELKAALEVGSGRQPRRESTVITTYKELQVHGPVTWREHVAAVRVNPSHKGNLALMEKIRAWTIRNDMRLLWAE